MQDILNLLSQAVNSEINDPENLAPLPAGFYGIISLRLKQLKIMEFTASTEEAKLAARELRKTVSELVSELIDIRVKKMVDNLLKGKPIEVDEYEKSSLWKLMSFINDINLLKASISEGKTKELENIEKNAPTVYFLVQFNQSLDKFMGSDLVEYGPFEVGDLATIPQENAKILIEKNIVKKVGEI
ncbi:MAG: hypothetical protein ACP5LW_02515 [Nitrososphaeria archaeon]